MSRTANLDRALVAAICASTALWLTACGGSSGTQTSASHTSASHTSATQTLTTRSSTTSTSAAEKARLYAAQVKAVAVYVECLRASGIHVPPPNTSGKGPVFDSKAADTKAPAFKTASAKCLAKAETFFHAHPH